MAGLSMAQCLQRAGPRAAGWWVEVGLHARVLGLLDKRGPGSCNRRPCSFTELEARVRVPEVGRAAPQRRLAGAPVAPGSSLLSSRAPVCPSVLSFSPFPLVFDVRASPIQDERVVA